MADILRTTVEDRRRMDRHARSVTKRCDVCGEGVYFGNLTQLKDGRALCSVCFENALDELFAMGE